MADKPTYEELERRVEELEKEAVECRQAKENLHEQLNLHGTILASTPDLFVVKDRDSVYWAANLAFCKFVGKKEEEIIGKTDFDLFPRTEAERYRRDDARIMETGIPKVQDEETTGGEGRKYLQVAKTPLVDETGTCVGVLCSVRDISERKRAEKALKQAHDELERRVEERTVALVKANEELRREIEERKLAEEKLRQSEREVRIRNRIAEIFLTTSGHETYGEVLDVILEAMESKYGTFAYINENGDRVVPSMTIEIWDKCKIREKDIFFPRETWGDNLWARCIIQKRAISSNGPFKVPDGHIPITRALAVPIIHQGDVVGNFMVGNKATDYDERDVELLETIADHTAPILHAWLKRAKHENERKRAEEEIRSLAKFPSENPNPVLRVSTDGTVLYRNEASLPFFDSWGPEVPDGYRKFILDALGSGISKYTEIECGDRVLSLTFAPVVGADYVNLYGLDITERKRAEEMLQEAYHELERRVEERTAELQHLSSRLLNVQEDERKRISRELHDSTGQSLAAIKFGLENAISKMPENTAKENVELFKALIPVIQQASDEVRRIHTDLRPGLLDDLGIIATISWFCRELERLYFDIQIKKQINIEEKEIPDSLKTVIFRILQEALHNVAKHAKPCLVRVALTKTDDQIELFIEDNGQGFDIDHALSLESSERRFGLTSMKERAELSRGSFAIESTPGAGTTIRASWQGGVPR